MRKPKQVQSTPASLGLAYRDVSFPAREDHVLIRGWFIPGVLPTGKLTADRTLIVVHGRAKNRADPQDGIPDLSATFARRGFAVLAFDMRGMGESPPAPDSLGFFEQRDVLGAVDFLRSGPPPYPLLARPRIVGGWGVSMGAISLILAAAREPAVRAVVAGWIGSALWTSTADWWAGTAYRCDTQPRMGEWREDRVTPLARSDPKAVVKNGSRAVNKHDVEAIAACFAADYHDVEPAHPTLQITGGRENVRKNYGMVLQGMPDLRLEILRVAADGDTIWRRGGLLRHAA